MPALLRAMTLYVVTAASSFAHPLINPLAGLMVRPEGSADSTLHTQRSWPERRDRISQVLKSQVILREGVVIFAQLLHHPVRITKRLAYPLELTDLQKLRRVCISILHNPVLHVPQWLHDINDLHLEMVHVVEETCLVTTSEDLLEDLLHFCVPTSQDEFCHLESKLQDI